jgi:uncharacterized RDD family membrane protein YckC
MENSGGVVQQAPRPVAYAGFWWRVLANLIDSLIIDIVSGIIILPFILVFGLSLFGLVTEGAYDESLWAVLAGYIVGILVLSLILWVMQWLYFALMESSRYQATLGKMVCNVIVTDMNGQRICFARATGRHFGKILSGMIFMIGFIMAGFTEKKQALHDMLAGCLVVLKNP